MDSEKPHYLGHRLRLRERFLKSRFAGMAEHEIVELLLTLAIPRKDVKKPAKELLARFGSVSYQQLCTYSHILETRDGRRPERLMLYWTGEPRKEDALMVFPYEPHVVDQAGAHFDEVVKSILNRSFEVTKCFDSQIR